MATYTGSDRRLAYLFANGGGGGGSCKVISGYYHNGDFYEDQSYTQIIIGDTECLYIDLDTTTLYLFDGTDYVEVQGGGGGTGGGGIETDAIKLGVEFDFTKSTLDILSLIPITLSNVTQNSNGLVFNNANAYASLDGKLLRKGMTYEIEISSLNITDTTVHNDIFRYQDVDGSSSAGFAFRWQSQVWAVWDSVNKWQESSITNKNYFDNCTLKIKILDNGKWEIYKDDVLVFAPPTAPVLGTANFGLGSPNLAAKNMTIKSFRAYVTGYKEEHIQHTYSTTEQVVGTWIDGKPIYECVFDLGSDTSVSSTSWFSTGITIPSLSNILQVWSTNSTGTYYPLMAYHSGGNINIEACRDGNTATVRWLCFRYTKSTT